MIRISEDDFKKLVAMITKVGMPGAVISFSITQQGVLSVKTVDRDGKDITIELTDTRWPMMPRITRTETF